MNTSMHGPLFLYEYKNSTHTHKCAFSTPVTTVSFNDIQIREIVSCEVNYCLSVLQLQHFIGQSEVSI